MKRLELLAPARDYASAVAAVDAGADAIYIGGARFGARHAAANSVDDIRRAAEYAHLYSVRVHAISHITGGGFYENVPRMLQDGFTAVIEKDKCFKKPIFELIAKEGNIPERDMYNTFNMGTGLVIAVDATKADEAVRILQQAGEQAAIIGQIKSGEKGVELV